MQYGQISNNFISKSAKSLTQKGMKRFQIIQYYGCCSFHTILPKDPFKKIYKTPLSQRIIPPPVPEVT